MDVTELVIATDRKRQAVGLGALNPIDLVVTLVSYARFEIDLGGLSSFYYNSAGDFARETVAALESLGAVHSAQILRRANSLFPGGSPSPDRSARYEQWHQVSAVSSKALSALDDALSADPDDLDTLMDRYVEGHHTELPTPLRP